MNQAQIRVQKRAARRNGSKFSMTSEAKIECRAPRRWQALAHAGARKALRSSEPRPREHLRPPSRWVRGVAVGRRMPEKPGQNHC